MSYLTKEQNAILTRAKARIRALNHPLRQRILVLVKSKRKMIVTDIYKKLDIEQSVASQQLAIMRRQGFVTTKREGKLIWYSVADDAIKAFLQKCAAV
ncbi:MAG: metalloregulator ArsR/SmtB family transcription factor [Bacteroidota bacterium]